jgi:DNA ligase (NAD+)
LLEGLIEKPLYSAFKMSHFMTVKEQIERLRERLNDANHHYYIHNQPVISDLEYDKLLASLANLEKDHPEYADPNSPTSRVGGDLVKDFPEVAHRVPMLSLGNSYNEDDLYEFDKRIRKRLGEAAVFSYVAEIKIDGLAMSLVFENGQLQRAITRGDGQKGNDITPNIRTIRSVPLSIGPSDFPGNFEVRGEVFMTKSGFSAFNQERIDSNDEPFANPRNAAAGSVKMLDTSEVAKRPLDAFWYYLDTPDGTRLNHWERLNQLKAMGFKTNPVARQCRDIGAVIAFCREWDQKRKSLDFETDGVVVKINETNLYEALGYTAKSPRWAIAYKFQAEQAQTRVNAITWQVGRTGAVTPVAELEPVQLAGTTVKRATLHNIEDLQTKDIRLADTVIIEKGGDIIPKVIASRTDLRDHSSLPVKAPLVCPVCATDLVKNDDDAHLRCQNPFCPAQVTRSIQHFASKDAMDIDGLGEKIVLQLYEAGIIENIADIYSITREQLLALESFKDKKADNLLNGITASKQRPFSRQLYALGIRFVGQETAKILASHFAGITDLSAATEEDIAAINGIGPRIAASIHAFLSNASNQDRIQQLKAAGLSLQQSADEQSSGNTFSGQTFVLTGTLPTLKRSEAKALIEENGGKVSSSVSAKTTFVLAGESAGSKLSKARELGLTILSEDTFLTMLRDHNASE